MKQHRRAGARLDRIGKPKGHLIHAELARPKRSPAELPASYAAPTAG